MYPSPAWWFGQRRCATSTLTTPLCRTCSSVSQQVSEHTVGKNVTWAKALKATNVFVCCSVVLPGNGEKCDSLVDSDVSVDEVLQLCSWEGNVRVVLLCSIHFSVTLKLNRTLSPSGHKTFTFLVAAFERNNTSPYSLIRQMGVYSPSPWTQKESTEGLVVCFSCAACGWVFVLPWRHKSVEIRPGDCKQLLFLLRANSGRQWRLSYWTEGTDCPASVCYSYRDTEEFFITWIPPAKWEAVRRSLLEQLSCCDLFSWQLLQIMSMYTLLSGGVNIDLKVTCCFITSKTKTMKKWWHCYYSCCDNNNGYK